MSVYESIPNRPIPLGSIGIFTVVTSVETLLRRLREWNERRLTVAALRRLSEDQLDDIGLCRADVTELALGR
jgi:uncharacterized protein YjiS (DUF1127 family)